MGIEGVGGRVAGDGLIVEEGTYIYICTECCKTISNIT